MSTAAARPEAGASPTGGGFEHAALFYRGDEAYAAGVVPFVEGGLARGEPVLVAVPAPRIELLRSCIGRASPGLGFVDMALLGRNPGRLIPAIRAFLDNHEGGRARFVGEPIWPERRPCEMVEGTRHEALINVAFSESAASILCPYDESRLDAAVLADARLTHPSIASRDGWHACTAAMDPAVLLGADRWRLPEPDGATTTLDYADDLAGVRELTRSQSARAGIGAERTADLVLAVNEAAANTLSHTGAGGTLRIWRSDGHLVCEVRDGGAFDDLLAGRRRPSVNAERGRGLWLMHQLCDLVELRTGETGTTVRLHMALETAARKRF